MARSRHSLDWLRSIADLNLLHDQLAIAIDLLDLFHVALRLVIAIVIDHIARAGIDETIAWVRENLRRFRVDEYTT